MIVRISGEGQFEVPEQFVAELNEVDGALADAVTTGDEASFSAALDRLLRRVHEVGTALADDALTPSEAILPAAGSSLADVRTMLGSEGLIPG